MGLSINAVILGVAMIAGSALLVMTHSEATQTCNVEWQLKLKEASAALEKKVQGQNEQIQELEKTLVKAVEDRRVQLESNSQILENQREKIPLSKACDECRVPRDRIWLRGSSKSGGPRGS